MNLLVLGSHEAPLPPGWHEVTVDDGTIMYIHEHGWFTHDMPDDYANRTPFYYGQYQSDSDSETNSSEYSENGSTYYASSTEDVEPLDGDDLEEDLDSTEHLEYSGDDEDEEDDEDEDEEDEEDDDAEDDRFRKTPHTSLGRTLSLCTEAFIRSGQCVAVFCGPRVAFHIMTYVQSTPPGIFVSLLLSATAMFIYANGLVYEPWLNLIWPFDIMTRLHEEEDEYDFLRSCSKMGGHAYDVCLFLWEKLTRYVQYT